MSTVIAGWSRAQYTIKIEDAIPIKVDGIACGEFGIHVAPDYQRHVFVTHLPSGKRVRGGFLTLGSAAAFVEKIQFLTDWSSETPILSEDARNIINRAYVGLGGL